MYGLEICAAAGLPSGTIHPILARLEGVGWLESRWEECDPHKQARPRRRYYHFTPEGIEHARTALAQANAKASKLLSGLHRRLADGVQ
ncbi:PadR family transcriptional regulator [Nonomuraea fuscirosea]|uniref:PadR family transcriptional regulator n=1 Tax=Nonomuraea fuscirosea TaxID=1291556 RepID=UPI0033CC0E92